MKKLYLMVFLVFIFVSLFSEQTQVINFSDDWYQITISIPIANITPEQAREKAMQKACQMAIEQFAGIEVTGRTSLIQTESNNEITMDHFSKLTNQISNGIILEKELIKEDNITENNLLYKRVTVKLKIGKQKGEKDPTFEISSELNREYFKDGEEMELSVKSSKDCYLTILNICFNDSVYVIFPNEYRKDNFLESGETFLLPNSKDKEIGLHFPVNLLPNKNDDVEMIKVIATKQKIDFSSIYSFSAYGTYQSTLKDLQSWLLKIPRNEIEEVDLQYFIHK